MALQNFIKDNIVLLIGIFLPLLLVVFFILASAIPRMMATPPKYDFLFTISKYSNKQNIKIDIRLKLDDNGHITSIITNGKNPSRYYPELYRYRAKEGYAVQIKPGYFLDEILDNNEEILKTKTIKIPKSIALLKLNDEAVSPDGYALDTSYRYRSGGLIGEIFSLRNRRCMYRLSKNNASFPFEIREIGNSYYNCRYYSSSKSIDFLGWVIPKDTVKD